MVSEVEAMCCSLWPPRPISALAVYSSQHSVFCSANVLDGDVPRHGLQLDRTLDGPHLDLAARRANAHLGAARDLNCVVDGGAKISDDGFMLSEVAGKEGQKAFCGCFREADVDVGLSHGPDIQDHALQLRLLLWQKGILRQWQ